MSVDDMDIALSCLLPLSPVSKVLEDIVDCEKVVVRMLDEETEAIVSSFFPLSWVLSAIPLDNDEGESRCVLSAEE